MILHHHSYIVTQLLQIYWLIMVVTLWRFIYIYIYIEFEGKVINGRPHTNRRCWIRSRRLQDLVTWPTCTSTRTATREAVEEVAGSLVTRTIH